MLGVPPSNIRRPDFRTVRRFRRIGDMPGNPLREQGAPVNALGHGERSTRGKMKQERLTACPNQRGTVLQDAGDIARLDEEMTAREQEIGAWTLDARSAG